MGWIMGPYQIVAALANGATLCLVEGAPDHPGPDRLWHNVADSGVTVLGMSPTLVRALMPHGEDPVRRHDLSSLRVMFTGGEMVPYERAREFEERTGATVLQFYGSNETGALSATTPADPPQLRLRTAGRVLPAMHVRLLDRRNGVDAGDAGK